MEVLYKVGTPDKFSSSERELFLKLLKKQGKITSPKIEKVNRCFSICYCIVDKKIVSIGAIKPKTNSDFNTEKANLEKLRMDFQKELGYCFTLPEQTGKGYSSYIIKLLLDTVQNENLMASTELRSDNSMVRILERNGFKQYGQPWKSGVHNGTLGLFLKYCN